MTVYRRPDPIPLHRARPSTDAALHAVRGDQEDLHRLVSRQIFAAIVSGAYPEGSILPNEEALSHELGVSRTALRESVKGLVAKGILETKRRRGTLVLPRTLWNVFDADVIAWLRRANGHSVTSELLGILAVALPGAAEMAAAHRTAKNLAQTALHAGDSSVEARARFLVELGAATSNAFVASLVATTVRSLLADAAPELDAWSGWLTPSRAQRLTGLVNAGDPTTAARIARHDAALEPASV